MLSQLHKILQGLYLSCYSWLAFCHTGLFYEYSVAFRCRLTADSRLHIARICGQWDMDLWSLRGLMWIRLLRSAHLCWPDTMRAWEGHCNAGHPRSSPPTAAVIIGLSREDQTIECMCLKARWCPVADWPYIQGFQVIVPEIIIAVLHCLLNGWHVGLLCAFGLYWWATHTWDVRSCSISSDLWVTW